MDLAFLPSPNPLLSSSPSRPLPFLLHPKRSREGHPFQVSASSNPGPPFGLPWQHLSRSFQRSSDRLWLNFGVALKKETGFNFGVSASTPSFISPIPTGEGSDQYDVFLSFRGSDTRKDFTNHLYHSLVNTGIIPICVFRDEKSIPIGMEFSSQIFNAITHSKISIPIISVGYASSKWCLRELIHMMNYKRSTSHIVLPIFYKVDPSDVRYLKGDFGKAFHSHKEHFDEKDIQEGKLALKEVSCLAGWESEKFANGREGELVKEVVKAVLSGLRRDFELDVTEHLVGIDDHVNKIRNWVHAPANSARMIGIYGMAGIGKTTLAKVIYNELSNDFVHCSCLLNIRETARQKGISYLQSQLINEIHLTEHQVWNVDNGVSLIRSRFKGKKVLIFLDDIDHQDQLNALARKRDWFASGSIIIITTRNQAILDRSEFEVDYKYRLNEMDEMHSLLLFNRHAFLMDHSPKNFEGISRDITSTMGGLPLALKVVGSYLYGKTDLVAWQEFLEKLRKESHGGVQKALKESYDALEDGQKEIFLDIACLFIGKESKFTIYMWEDYGFYASQGIEELKLRSLIEIGNDGLVKMHDQLRNLGRSIIFQGQLPERHSRLWVYEEANGVLVEKKDGTDSRSKSDPLSGLETIFQELQQEEGIEDVRINGQGFEKRGPSQGLQLSLSDPPPRSKKFVLLARAGRQVREIKLTTLLDPDGIRKALQRVLERVPWPNESV